MTNFGRDFTHTCYVEHIQRPFTVGE